ncbi:MAG: HAMP domain-containing sensor histidine kinase [Ferruginibacter sp.]
MSIKFKIVMLFVALVTLIVSIGSIAIYFFSLKERQDTFRVRLKNRALTSAKIFSGDAVNNLKVLRRLDTAGVASLYEKSIVIFNANNAQQYSFADKTGDTLIVPQSVIEDARVNEESYFSYNDKRAVAIKHLDNDSYFILAVAATDLDGRGYLRQLKSILLFSLLLAASLSFLAGLFFASHLIFPIKRITGEVNLISSNDLSQRIKISPAQDELTQLALTFNHLLDRMQESFSTQRRFISNASHELSNPLTSISSQIEVIMQKNRTSEEYRDTLQSVYEDTRELQQLTRSLLEIARTGSQGSLDLSEVRLDEVLFKVVSDIQRQNRQYKANINFDVFPDEEKLMCIFGNANLLYIAFKNIIENGCKYADDNKSYISVTFDKSNITIKVFNKGDVISEADIQHIFQPFFRAETAQNKPGFGLGLTLAKRILSLHKGTVEVVSDPELGTTFTIHLSNVFSAS